jgi:hypothetical protein
MPTPNPTATMSESSPYAGHTPGPWSPVQSVNGKICIECDNDTLTIAVVETIHTVRDKAEQVANARLIAAAPTLLQENTALRAALVWQTQILEDYWYSKNTEEKNFAAEGIQSAIDHARAALAGKEVQS